MFSGLGSVLIGDGDFLNKVLDVCLSEFMLTEALDNYTYDYLSSSSQYLKPSPTSVRLKSRKWTLQVCYENHNVEFMSLLESNGALPTDDFTPSLVLVSQGPNGLQGRVNVGVTLKAYNLTQQRQEIPSGITFPSAEATDLIYVAIDDTSATESRSYKALFDPNVSFKFISDLYIKDKVYRLSVNKMVPTSLIEVGTNGKLAITYEIIDSFKIFEIV